MKLHKIMKYDRGCNHVRKYAILELVLFKVNPSPIGEEPKTMNPLETIDY